MIVAAYTLKMSLVEEDTSIQIMNRIQINLAALFYYWHNDGAFQLYIFKVRTMISLGHCHSDLGHRLKSHNSRQQSLTSELVVLQVEVRHGRKLHIGNQFDPWVVYPWLLQET